MDLEDYKYHTCYEDDGEGILLTALEKETAPVTDEDGNWQYYCMDGHHTFSVDIDGDEE